MEEITFKDISFLELWQPFCSTEKNYLKVLRGIILNLSQWFRTCPLKDFLPGALVHARRTDAGQRPITIAHIEPLARVS